MPCDTILEDINSVWSPSRYAIEHTPLTIGQVPPSWLLSRKSNVLDMPIKLPRGEFVVPGFAGEGVKDIVGRCLEAEKELNQDWEAYHCYLTINQGVVRSSETQRNPGVHFDGMQGTRYSPKLKACHQYLVSSALPTTFYVQSFDATALDADRDNWFTAFGRQADESCRYFPAPFDLVLMTAYCVHAATVAAITTSRTFVRVEFSLKQFNRRGNTINPLLETGWTYEDRPIPIHFRS